LVFFLCLFVFIAGAIYYRHGEIATRQSVWPLIQILTALYCLVGIRTLSKRVSTDATDADFSLESTNCVLGNSISSIILLLAAVKIGSDGINEVSRISDGGVLVTIAICICAIVLGMVLYIRARRSANQ